MEPDVGERHDADPAQHLQVAPFASCDQLAPADERHQRQEHRIDHHRHRRPDDADPEHRQPPREPDRRQQDERPTGQRHLPGPVRDRGHQEAREHGRPEAEQHLVGVPGHRAIVAAQRKPPGDCRDPERHRRHGDDSRPEKERPETVRKKRGAVMLQAARNPASFGRGRRLVLQTGRGHGRSPPLLFLQRRLRVERGRYAP